MVGRIADMSGSFLYSGPAKPSTIEEVRFFLVELDFLCGKTHLYGEISHGRTSAF